MIIVNNVFLNKLSDEASKSTRKRLNHNFHESYDDPLQRFLNAIEPGTYVTPHRHIDPPKTELFFILRGKVLVVEFDDNGNIIEHIVLDEKTDNKAVEIKAGIWHMCIALESDTVIYEVKAGPFINGDKGFASWAPQEGDTGCSDYLNKIILKCIG